MMKKDEWMKLGKMLFGADMHKWRFKCPCCGHVQTLSDFVAADVSEPERKIGFSCIGRYLDECEGELGNDKSPCNYSLGGLLKLDHVIILDGITPHTLFAFETGGRP